MGDPPVCADWRTNPDSTAKPNLGSSGDPEVTILRCSIGDRSRPSFATRLTCIRRPDNGASIGVTIVGEWSLPEAITSHASIK
jgi:hypothetical protein